MKTRRLQRAILWTTTGLAFAMLSACASLEGVAIPRSNPAEMRESVHPGETVVVRLVSGEEKRFKVRAFETDAIVGRRGERVPYDDISTLDVSKRDVEGTVKTALVLTAVAVGALALLVIEAELEEDGTDTY